MSQYSTHPKKIKIHDDDGDVLEINADGTIGVVVPDTTKVKVWDGTDELAVNTDGSITTQLLSKICTNNSTDTPLLANATFTGTAGEMNGYASILITVYTDVASATDGLSIQFSHTDSPYDWHESDAYTIAAGAYKTFTLQPVDAYFRIVYTNGGSDQTAFHINVQLHSVAPKASSHRMEDDISGQDDAQLVKSILAAERPGTAGIYTNIQATNGGNLKVSVEEFDGLQTNPDGNQIVQISDNNLDAFSRMRVSLPIALFDSSFRYDLDPLIFETSTANGGSVTHAPARAAAALALDGTAGGSAIIQSKEYMQYVPGRSQLILITGLIGAGNGNQKRVGYFDANNGIYFEQDTDDSIKIVRRTDTSGSPVNNEVEQANWNLDTLDGNGFSGITLDPTKVYILVIDLQWLGMGRVRVGFDINGEIVWAHEFLNANVLTTVYMRTGSLPVRWEHTGDNADSMDAVCSAVLSESGNDSQLSYHFSGNVGEISAGTSATYAGAIRPAATFNSITNRTHIQLESAGLTVTGNYAVRLEIYYGGTIGGSPSWTAANASSALEVDVAGTPSGGVKIDEFVVGATSRASSSLEASVSHRFPLCLDIAGTGYNLIYATVTSLGVSSSDCYPDFKWNEYR